MKDSGRVLLVGRNKKNLELLTDFLEKNGIDAFGVQDLTEASSVSGKGVSLVLVDVSGYARSIWTFLNELLEKKLPFLVIYPPEAKGRATAPVGSSAVLTKPLNPKVLLSVVKNLLGDLEP
ncbi:hypothetical protein DBT_0214 [Dissulfuribacter thermophilus]|uniref:Response regulatory domain-containing protein n=1 Tax=Dissulfuribacter thermophilus TaxID=1156395 RepID=A0A1B9F8Y0_9BACT|nr:response regulator transcription factor [Dissulfuribacter thermophilus]OCC16397.1 hypothetical protein DBT_0214 [Dissulfuribacter thermophilus]